MKTTKRNEPVTARAVSRSFRAIILEASEEELDEALIDEGFDPQNLYKRASEAAERALSSHSHLESGEEEEAEDFHRGLGTLIKLLRRKARLSQEDLAQKARIDLEELRRIEFDTAFTPSPRAIYQLEEYFQLPKLSLALLSGGVAVQSQEFKDEVLRFAAHSRELGRLSREEKKLLNQFVRFLGEHTKKKSGQ